MRSLLVALLTAALVLAGGTAALAAPADGPTEYTLAALRVDGRGDSRITVVGNGGTVRLRLDGLKWRYRGDAASEPRIVLQRKVDGRWRRVSATSVSVPDDLERRSVIVKTRPYRTKAAKETLRYRLLSVPYEDASGSVVNTDASEVFSVRYENQDRYRGLALVAWQAVQPYCPTTAVRIGGVGGDAAGVFHLGASEIRLDPLIGGYPAEDLRSVALHECAHLRQWLEYGSSTHGNDVMEAAAAAIYVDDAPADGSGVRPSEQPFDPVEHAADCAATAIEPGGYLGYGGWCNDAERAAGLRLMGGERY